MFQLSNFHNDDTQTQEPITNLPFLSMDSNVGLPSPPSTMSALFNSDQFQKNISMLAQMNNEKSSNDHVQLQAATMQQFMNSPFGSFLTNPEMSTATMNAPFIHHETQNKIAILTQLFRQMNKNGNLGKTQVPSMLHNLDGSDCTMGDQFNCSMKNKLVPKDYLCHLCFKKGHFIQECPLVSILFHFIGPELGSKWTNVFDFKSFSFFFSFMYIQ